jgi:sugar transferase (PEP-CTERM system associated)
MVRVFGHYVPRALVVLATLEMLTLVVSFYSGVHLRFSFGGEAGAASLSAVEPLFNKAVLYALAILGAMTTMGLYSRHFRDTTSEIVMRVLVSFAMGLMALVLLFYLLPGLFVGRGALALVLVLSALGIVCVRLIFQHIATMDTLKKRILVLGAGNRAGVIDRVMRRKSDRRGISIVGYINLDGEPQVGGKVIAHDEPLQEIVRRYRVQELIVAVDDRRRNFPIKEIVDCRLIGVEVTDLLSFIERQCSKVLLEGLNPSWLIFSEGFHHGMLRAVWKRIFDVTASLLLLAVAWPVMLLVAFAVLLEDRGRGGPVLYRQERVGEHGATFQVLKFRSMTVDAEKDGSPQWAQKNDARITRIGGILRKYRIDELPQLFNVLRGDMSFVGPRPERPEFVRTLSENILYYAERHRVKPGITGWAQICYPYGASEQDAKEKLQYDLYYVKNYSIFLDLVILLQTAQAVFLKKGAR